MTADRVEVFADSAGEYRWHRVAPNGEIVSTSGEGFSSRQHAERAAERANREVGDSDDPLDAA